MTRRVPLIALWSSLTYLLVAFAVTSKLCLDQVRALVRGAAEATGGGFGTVSLSPSGVILSADAVVDRLWWLCFASGFGILLTALSAVWISLSTRGPASADPGPKTS